MLQALRWPVRCSVSFLRSQSRERESKPTEQSCPLRGQPPYHEREVCSLQWLGELCWWASKLLVRPPGHPRLTSLRTGVKSSPWISSVRREDNNPTPENLLFQYILSVWSNGVHSASWVQLRSYLKEKVAAPVKKTEITAVGIRHADHVAPSIRKSWH
jgi:hypothetical protein